MIAAQIAGTPGDDDAGIEEARLQPAQILLAAAIGEGDDGSHPDALRAGSRFQRDLDIASIEAEDRDLHALLRSRDGREQRPHAGLRLDDQFHRAPSSAIRLRIERVYSSTSSLV